jgi:hypothetical protein
MLLPWSVGYYFTLLTFTCCAHIEVLLHALTEHGHGSKHFPNRSRVPAVIDRSEQVEYAS